VCQKLIKDILSKMDEFQLSNESFVYFQNKLPEELIKKSTGVFELDATHCKIKDNKHSIGEPGEADKVFETLFIVSTKLLNNKTVPIAYGLGGVENSKNWLKMMSCFKTCNEEIIDNTFEGNNTILADNQKGFDLAVKSLDSIWLNTKIHTLTWSIHLKRNLLKIVSPNQVAKASALYNMLLHTMNQSSFNLYQEELVNMILPKYKSNSNTTYKIISKYPEKFARFKKKHNVSYYECHSTNGVENKSRLNIVKHGVMLMNQELFKTGLLDIKKSMNNHLNERIVEVGIKEEIKSNITLEKFQDIIFSYNKLVNRRCNFISSRTTVYKELYHTNAQVNLAKLLCLWHYRAGNKFLLP